MEAVPERSLPSTDHTIVVAYGTMPKDRIVLVDARDGENDTCTATMSGPTTTAQCRWVIEIRGRIHDDVCKILCQKPGTRWHRSHRTCRCQVMPQINDPGVTQEGSLRIWRTL